MSKVGYRAGPVDRKTEFQSQFSYGSRSTGYFGTGYYFCTKPEYCAGLSDGERPLYKLTFKDSVNWFYGTRSAHDSLKLLSAYVYNYTDLLNWVDQLIPIASYVDHFTYGEDKPVFQSVLENYEAWRDEDEPWSEWIQDNFDTKYFIGLLKECDITMLFYNELIKDNPDWDKLSKYEEQFTDYFDYNYLSSLKSMKFKAENYLPYAFDTTLDYINEFADKYHGYHKEHRYDEADSIMTVFLKSLGYDGVWPSPECDNTTYGGVIYEKDSIEKIELLSEKAKDYQ